MPVSVKEYLNSMSSVSSSTKASTASSNDTKMQALLSQLIEAIAYANSVDFRAKTLNNQAPGTAKAGETGKQVLDNMKAQEKLVKQLAEGQKLTNDQSKELKQTIDKFYELIGAQEVNYKKFAKNLEKFALQDLPEAVQNRLINDSRDAHIIGQDNKRKEGPILPIIKRIRNLLEDSAENTKQFTKKLFVSLDAFKAGLLGSFDKLGELFEENSIGGFIRKIGDMLNGVGMLWMALQGQFKEGNFKWGQGIKQFDNIKTMFKAFKEVGGAGAGLGKSFKTMTNGIKSIKSIFKTFSRLPKFFAKFGKMGGLAVAGKSIGKSIGKGLGKSALKKIPFLGLALSGWMAWERWQKKDYVGSLLEIASGVASIFPGIGTAVSIGIDLINLGRDTGAFKNIGKTAAKTGKDLISKMPENLIMSLPGIGPVYGIIKAANLYSEGNKKGALVMIGKSIASIVPGGASVVQLLIDMMGMKDITKLKDQSSSSSSSWWHWPWGKKKGQGSTGKGSGEGTLNGLPPGLGDSGSSNIGNTLGYESLRTAKSMGGAHSTHYCATGVTKTFRRALGETIGGHAYQMTDSLKNSKFGKKYFTYKGKSSKDTFSPNELPAGTVLGWSRYPGNSYGHIEIANGSGLLSSDFYRDQRYSLGSGYRKYGVKPDIFVPKGVKLSTKTRKDDIKSSAADAASSEAIDEATEQEEPKTFSEIMDMFNKFNEGLVEGVEPASVDTGHFEFPGISAEDLSAGTPAATTASAVTTMKSSSKPATGSYAVEPKQVSATMPNSNPPDSIDTEIRDTDLMLLNSILFS